MKKFWKYLTLTILFLLGLGCVGVLYLFFVPSSTLFGIAYITHNQTIDSTTYSVEDINTIKLNSRSYDVKVVPTESSDISVKMISNSFGFVLTKNEEASIQSNLNTETNILTFDITEPYGAIFKGDSKVELYLPSSKVIDLEINNKNAETSIFLPESGVNTLKYTSENGDASVVSGKINKNLNLTLNKSNFKLYSKVSAAEATIDLSVTSGKFDSTETTIRDINITKNERGVILLNNCNNIYENVKSSGGRIEANNVSFANISSSETNVYIKKISNGAIINLSGSANVTIDDLTSSSHIESSYGKINLNKTNSYVYLRTINGSINVANAFSTIDLFIEGSGSANINFSEEAESNLTNNDSRRLAATLKSGSLSCTGVESVGVTSTGNSSIKLNMINVYGNNSVHNENGSTSIVVNKYSVYKLTTNPEEPTLGSVRVNLSQVPEHDGYTNKDKRETWVNCSKNQNNGHYLEVSSASGNILILDTNFA